MDRKMDNTERDESLKNSDTSGSQYNEEKGENVAGYGDIDPMVEDMEEDL